MKPRLPRIFPLAFVFLASIVINVGWCDSEGIPLRIMPLGDSITAGSYGAGKDGIGGYRAPLWFALKSTKVSFDFVGSINDPAGVDWDADHDGHRAWRADNIADSVQGWLEATKPDVILLQIGVNDIIQGADTGTVLKRMDILLRRVVKMVPKARIFVASILSVREGNDYKVTQKSVLEYNRGLKVLVEEMNRERQLSHFVDLERLCHFQDDDFSADGLHPSDAGYVKMARAWSEVLISSVVDAK